MMRRDFGLVLDSCHLPFIARLVSPKSSCDISTHTNHILPAVASSVGRPPFFWLPSYSFASHMLMPLHTTHRHVFLSLFLHYVSSQQNIDIASTFSAPGRCTSPRSFGVGDGDGGRGEEQRHHTPILLNWYTHPCHLRKTCIEHRIHIVITHTAIYARYI